MRVVSAFIVLWVSVITESHSQPASANVERGSVRYDAVADGCQELSNKNRISKS